jgi:hypothetical protein
MRQLRLSERIAMAGHAPALALAAFLVAGAMALVVALAVIAPLSAAVLGVCAGTYGLFHRFHNEASG